MKNGILIIGYGNVYCHDDGVALYIINELRRRWGIPELQADEDGLEEVEDSAPNLTPQNRVFLEQPLSGLPEGYGVDTIMLHQLVPEIVSLLANYRMVVFVDAHIGSIPEEVRIVRVQEEHHFHAVTHQMSPGMVLSITRETKGVAPVGYLVSVKGDNFDFGLGLSDQCRRCADMTIQKILDLVQGLPPTEMA
jgi:hydrogenase maturation protease